ncbi:MAG TPA: hypothetical protein VGJ94_04360 [Syntrophorhabdaceae bacterium]|jgi:hypothetical protein
MKPSCKTLSLLSIAILSSILLTAFLPSNAHAGIFDWASGNSRSKPERTVSSYEGVGREWGKALKNLRPNEPLNQEFVGRLIDPSDIDFFNVHSDLKEAFKKGFRMGFEDRTADLVLGPHLTAAAGRVGYDTSSRFVKVITDFEVGWAATLKYAVDVFIVLISEGSQADRETFIYNFMKVYGDKYNSTQAILKGRTVMTQMSDGGTLLYLDYSKGKVLGALDIPSATALKTEIYRQTFKVMGDEWGRRFSTNLIRRDDLIDLLRRCKTALTEIEGNNNLGIIYDAFNRSYGTDAHNVFQELVKAAGYRETPVPYSITPVSVTTSVTAEDPVVKPTPKKRKQR